MTKRFRQVEFFILLCGDIAVLVFSVWLALFLRHFTLPTEGLFATNIGPFSVLILITILVFFIAGLYDKHTALFKEKLPGILLKSQIINTVIAIGYFYFTPSVGIAPKAVLFLYLVVSLVLMYLWRLRRLFFTGKASEQAILIGAGEEYDEFAEEIKKNSGRYGFTIANRFNIANNPHNLRAVIDSLESGEIRLVILDMHNELIVPLLPELYRYIHEDVSFGDFYDFYEQIFDKIPLAVLDHTWALRYASHNTRKMYDIPKRIMDVIVSIVLGIASLVLYPFVMLAILLDDGRPIFIRQERIGEHNRVVHYYKFRSMKTNDNGRWQTELYENITRVGRILRKSRIDELPQLWGVIVGTLSLVGPRPDIIDLGTDLANIFPYYSVRTVIKPGLSGWAQIKQDVPPHSIEETKIRLSYDLYYIKHRSLLLDLQIALQTIKTLLSRAGK